MDNLRIAVIGSGISGLAAAWLLAKSHRVTLFERDSHIGGHVNTVAVDAPGGRVDVDTGFVVYNETNYPNLAALFRHLGVATRPSEMSFALSRDGGAYEYSGSGISGFFGQPANLVFGGHWKLLAEILRFFRSGRDGIAIADPSLTLRDLLARAGYSHRFAQEHLVPMGAAIWSVSTERMLDYPAAAFLRFYRNHGLMQMWDRPRWRTVVGGAKTYVRAMLDDSDMEVRPETGIRRIRRHGNHVEIEDASGVSHIFDHVVIAAHADQALDMLADADSLETALLGSFSYQRNLAVLHSEPSYMPRRRRLWSSWNYIRTGLDSANDLCVTYWMNRLQGLETKQNVFVTLNPPRPVPRHRVWASFDYDHPVFDAAADAARKRLWELQGRGNVWFCGAHFGDGFHEDGIQAGLAVAEQLGGLRRPWRVERESGRIAIGLPAVRVHSQAAE
jgi:uncharacterized protein